MTPTVKSESHLKETSGTEDEAKRSDADYNAFTWDQFSLLFLFALMVAFFAALLFPFSLSSISLCYYHCFCRTDTLWLAGI
jgi:hypothetical protein